MNWFQIGVSIACFIGFVVSILIIAIRASNYQSERLRYKIAEAYQVIAELGYIAELFDDPEVIRALDHFADPDKFLDVDLLPWYPDVAYRRSVNHESRKLARGDDRPSKADI